MDQLAAWLPVKAFVLVLALAASARADSLSLGVAVGVPGEGSGLPISGRHIPIALVGQYRLGEHHAVAAGLGVPIASVGASLWSALELRVRPASRVSLYVAPGLRTGFVGPGYYARHSDVFVGFDYIYSGPWTIAPRLAVGAAVTVSRWKLVVEALVEAPLLPGPELLVGGSIGLRVRVW